MKLTLKSTLSATGLLVGGFLGASALMVMAAGSVWTGAPAGGPPNNNVAAPINVGDSAQVKTGLLSLGNFQFAPGGAAVAPGSVLMADSAGNGTVKWGTVSGGGNAGVTTGGDATNGYWYQIGSMLIEGGMAYPGTAKYGTSAVSVTFPKSFSTLASLQFTPLNSGTFGQVHPEQQVMVTAITTTGFKYQTLNNNGGSWLAVGSI